MVPEEPMRQLIECVRSVYCSWHSEKAIQYRTAMSISEHWGTAVLIMPMLQANSKEAGASVFFTRDPKTFRPIPYGETKRASTGDDIVYGSHLSLPLSRVQATDEPYLEEEEPDLYGLHAEVAQQVEAAMDGVPQEIEAAYLRQNDQWKLFVLQTRAMEFYHNQVDRFHEVCRMESNILARGIGVHGGALSGVVTFEKDTETLMNLKKKQRCLSY
jgi:pyruvate,orthophosphate dikinase